MPGLDFNNLDEIAGAVLELKELDNRACDGPSELVDEIECLISEAHTAITQAVDDLLDGLGRTGR